VTAPVQAIIMAGGKGARLHPYTAVLPKPLMPLGDRPILELLLRSLRSQGIQSVYLAVNHLHHLIRAFFGDGLSVQMNIKYSVEDEALGTAGPIAGLLDAMADDFLVLNGDLLTTMNISHLMDHHRQTKADPTIATALHQIGVQYGVLNLDDNGRVVEYREKPSHTYAVSMGIYALRREALRGLIEPQRPIEMPSLLGAMIEAGMRVVSYREPCVWLDIGNPDDYARAQELLPSLPVHD